MRRMTGAALLVGLLAAGCGDQYSASTMPTTSTPEQPRQSSSITVPAASALPTPSYREVSRPPEPTPTDTALPTEGLSPGVAALLTECAAGRASQVDCTRWALTLFGYLDDEVPKKYGTEARGEGDALALTSIMNGTRLTPQEEASIRADVDAFTRG